jgi:sporulation protein YlmC with PRC-barrel domain
MMRIGLLGAGMAAAHVVGTRQQASKKKDTSSIIHGFSAKRQVLGQKVFNNGGELVGRIEDLILAKRSVSYAIVGVGGFLRLGTHAVAIPVGKFIRVDERIVLSGASKEAIRAMPRFEYAQMLEAT